MMWNYQTGNGNYGLASEGGNVVDKLATVFVRMAALQRPSRWRRRRPRKLFCASAVATDSVLKLGQRVMINGKEKNYKGIVSFIGEIAVDSGIWIHVPR